MFPFSWNMMPCHFVIRSQYKGSVRPRRFCDLSTLAGKDGTIFLRNAGIYLPSDTALYSTRTESSGIPPRKPKNSWEKINFDLRATNNRNFHKKQSTEHVLSNPLCGRSLDNTRLLCVWGLHSVLIPGLLGCRNSADID